ncbi:MAG: esterase/lipase [Bacillota bacterium]|nr:esterase/lipase [Bacillota bacterium]
MGGLLTANLWNYGFAGIITVNTPVYYWNLRNIVMNLLSDFRGNLRKYIKAANCSPLASLVEFQKLLFHTKPMFSNITSRALIIQAMDDDTVHHRSADYIYGKLCGEKSLYRVIDGGHMLFRSQRGPEICGVIERFVLRIHLQK